MKVIIAGLSALAVWVGLLILNSPEASARPLCEHRSAAHLAEHGGVLEDNRYHVSRGELPNCESSEADRTSDDPTNRAGSDHNDGDDSSSSSDEGKSRYCRKHVFC
jgi:hypothetical protein